ncbi:S-protein homolog 1-like [Durio zibethinus]|uniref:S-protein homolog n=1 Tax=Durio zibethinus TaxID=66656 RepID=A0A6P6A464_DURZI|nr:S-protein homolog 1-like [Durio zibethinus]
MRSSNTLVLLLLVSAIAIVIHPYFVAPQGGLSPEFIRWHVYVVNGLSNNTTLFLHCKSKDDDLGVQNLSAGTNFTWSFQQNIFRRTLFWCYVSKDDNAHAAFKVFWQDVLLFHKCSWKNCIWTAKDDGIYIKDLARDLDEFRGKWEP